MKIAIIAHDGKKAEMVSFLMKNHSFLDRDSVNIVSTGTTGSHVERANLDVVKLLSGPLGGDAQIASLVAQKEIDYVFFFRDPLDKHPHEPDINMLMRICDVHNVPLATNIATADSILKGIDL